MQKNILSRHAAAIVVLFTLGSTLVTQGRHASAQSAWIAVICAAAVSVPVVAVYMRLQRLFPGKSLYDICYLLLGRFGGAVVTVLYILFFSHLALYLAHMFALFLNATDLPKTPQWIAALPLVLIAAWLASLGHTRIAKAAVILLVVVIFDILLTAISAIPTLNFTHMLPVVECEPAILLDDAYSFFVTPFTQSVALLCIFQHLPSAKDRRRGWFIGLGVSALLLALIYVRTTLILGGSAVSDMNYATYRSSSVIKIDAFIQRIEMFVSDGFVPSLLLKMSLYFYAIGQGVCRLKKACKPSAAIIASALVTACALPFLTFTAAQSFDFLYILRLYAPIFQVGLPVFLWLIAEIRNRRKQAEAGGGGVKASSSL